MTGDLNDDGSSAAGEGHELSPAEQALLEAALGFYGAANGVIDYESERPQLRRDAAGFEAVRRAMAALEAHVRAASAADVPPARIAEVARIDPEMVELILRREPAAAPDPSNG